MTTKTECKHYERCEAPLCPLQTREENKKEIWHPSDPVCRMEEFPSWVSQQIRIGSEIKLVNSRTYFTLEMLEAPLKVTKNVKGIDQRGDPCRLCLKIGWFLKNGLPVPEEVKEEHLVEAAKAVK
jgi:hypothetical protein